MENIQIGKQYQDSRGFAYRVLAIAVDSGDLEKELVMYESLSDTPDFQKGARIVSPLAVFSGYEFGENGTRTKRFTALPEPNQYEEKIKPCSRNYGSKNNPKNHPKKSPKIRHPKYVSNYNKN